MVRAAALRSSADRLGDVADMKAVRDLGFARELTAAVAGASVDGTAGDALDFVRGDEVRAAVVV